MRKTKLCSSCKEEIDAKATKCPHCHAKQTSGCLKIVLAIFLGFICLCFISFCISSTHSGNGPSGSSSSGTTVSTGTTLPDAHQSKWIFSEKKDEFDGKIYKYCSVESSNYIKDTFSSIKVNILVRMKGKTLDVMIIADGVVFGHLGSGNKVRLKFDEEQPFSVGYGEAADGSSDTIFLRSTSKIIEKLKKSKKLVIELPVFMESGQRASFDIEGYADKCKF